MQNLWKTLMKKVPALAYFYEHLNLRSSVSYRFVLDQEMFKDYSLIEAAFNQQEAAKEILQNPHILAKIELALKQLKPIQQTLNQLSEKKDLSDIDCFEIKHFAFINQQLKTALSELNFKAIILPDLSRVITVLDPENTKVPTFWVYDAYHVDLRKFRAEYKNANEQDKGRIRYQIDTIETQVLHQLTNELTQDSVK